MPVQESLIGAGREGFVTKETAEKKLKMKMSYNLLNLAGTNYLATAVQPVR